MNGKQGMITMSMTAGSRFVKLVQYSQMVICCSRVRSHTVVLLRPAMTQLELRADSLFSVQRCSQTAASPWRLTQQRDYQIVVFASRKSFVETSGGGKANKCK